jgi:hypothetical protein
MSWRDHLPIHPAAELFPLMSKDELRELADDIKKSGQVEPIALYTESVDKRGNIKPRPEVSVLDGRNRLDARELFDEDLIDDFGQPYCRYVYVTPPTDPYAYVLSKNIHRRHLTPEQKRELIVKVLKAKPEQSNRQIAKQVKADHKTVGAERKRLESTGEIPPVAKDGRRRWQDQTEG